MTHDLVGDGPLARCLTCGVVLYTFTRPSDCPGAAPAPPTGLTVEQVIAACEAAWPDSGYDSLHVRLRADERWDAWAYKMSHLADFVPSTADTPEAAIQQLGADALARIRERRDRDEATLRRCGVES